ncbi:MAG: TolC family protein [Labilithrix sp.]|nr:TolC family protein [Labilithrix sp.]
MSLGAARSAEASSSAEAPAASPSITLSRAIHEGALRSPGVAESSVARTAAVAFAHEPGSSLPSAPQLTILAGARAPRGLPTGPEAVVSVQQEIAARGLGSARRRAAEWTARTAESDLERARLEGGAAAALAWIDLLEAQSLVRLRSSGVEDAAKLARLAEVRVASGTATAVERSLAKAEVGNAELAVLDGEGRATEARIALAHATGQPLDRAFFADGVLDGAGDVPTDERLASRGVGDHPAVRAADGRAAQSAAEASVARASAGPSFMLGATAWREGSGDRAAALTLTVPLPFFDPARYDTARQAAIAAAASGHASRVRAELEREVHLAVHDSKHAREVRAQLRDGVVKPLGSALGTAMTAYAAGTNDLGVVLLARRSALAAEERLVVAMADVWRADVRVSVVAGTLLHGAGR